MFSPGLGDLGSRRCISTLRKCTHLALTLQPCSPLENTPVSCLQNTQQPLTEPKMITVFCWTRNHGKIWKSQLSSYQQFPTCLVMVKLFLLPGASGFCSAGNGGCLSMNLPPLRNSLNQTFFLTALYILRTQSPQPPSKYPFSFAQVGGGRGTETWKRQGKAKPRREHALSLSFHESLGASSCPSHPSFPSPGLPDRTALSVCD